MYGFMTKLLTTLKSDPELSIGLFDQLNESIQRVLNDTFALYEKYIYVYSISY